MSPTQRIESSSETASASTAFASSLPLLTKWEIKATAPAMAAIIKTARTASITIPRGLILYLFIRNICTPFFYHAVLLLSAIINHYTSKWGSPSEPPHNSESGGIGLQFSAKHAVTLLISLAILIQRS